GSPDAREIRLALARKGRRQGNEDRVGLLEHSVVGGRSDQPAVDELLQDLRGDIADVALAAVDPVDDVFADVDEHDVLPYLREDLGQGQADVAGTDDRNVPLHDGGRLYRSNSRNAPVRGPCRRPAPHGTALHFGAASVRYVRA